MIFQQHLCSARIPWRCAILAAVMGLLVTGVIALAIYFGKANGQDSILYSKAEPIKQGIESGITISFPFNRNAYSNSTSKTIVGTVPNPFSCPKHHFACNSSRKCLPLEKRCDGTVDCPKAEDELNCVCAFRMPPIKFCDKYPDCFDESDESFCSYCPEGSFNCGDGKCIPRNKVCDSAIDCNNFMDENFCFRLSSNIAIANADSPDPADSTKIVEVSKTGFLLRNRKGVWYPVCANPRDFMQDALASFACVSITANPLAGSTHQFKSFDRQPDVYKGDYVYHYLGRFVQWNGCLTDKGIFVSCDDVRCGFNPKHLLPRRPQGRIVGGELSEPGAWPWHGAIYKNGTYACGATLITKNWLISAAHCFLSYTNNYYEVQLGMLRRRSFTPHQKTYRIDKVVPHHKFNIVTLDFDIVMLRIAEPVVFDFWVRPICLPDPRRIETSGSICTAIGWGDTGESDDDSDDLLEVTVPLTESCRKNMDRWMCAGFVEGGRDACQGDSGGPLMCLQEDGLSWYIAGVISAGTGCARPKTPGMYTRVVYFLDWIQKIMMMPDNKNPPLSSCPGWTCAAVGGGNCLRVERVCDGHVDCYDAQDEANCLKKKI
ncbi:serine protease nudel-like [Stegodyphus dumicola]|uniref:serine protease nudel-like n=1 Tax=Stegodyphus dumicola TaxID=202533 RepID=UPI0015B0FA14|nr:serine protease nudel-like [Stegodyphus dumicola]